MKWILRLIGLVAVLMIVLVVSVLFLPADRFAQIATDQLRAATGRDVSVSGVSITFWPVLGVRAGELEVSNASWAAQGPMLQASGAAIGFNALALLRGEIRITNIEAQSPTIRLEQKADGRASWQFADASGAARIETGTSPQRAPRPVSIQRLQVTDATLIYDAEGSDRVSYSGVDLALDWPDRLGPAALTAVLRPTDEPVTVDATIDGFAGFITGETRNVSLRISAGPGDVSLEGRASTAGDVAGSFAVTTTDTSAFLQALKLPGVALPPKLGRSIDMTTQLTLTADRMLSLREVALDLGGNRLTGAADIGLNGTPQINARLDAGPLDLSDLDTGATAGQNGGGSAPAPVTTGWPTDRIDARALAAFNGDIALSAESIDLGRFRLGQTRSVLRNDNSRLVFELSEVAAYGAAVTGQFVINNRSGLSVGGNLRAGGIQMQPLLDDAIGLNRLTGAGDLRLSFLATGASVDQMMRSLSGDGNLNIGRGTIEGIDLDRLMRSGETGAGTTVFDRLTGSWTISAGVLSNRDLLLELANYRATGEGTVGIGAQVVDYTATPIALRADSGRGISIPVRFTGPWSDISIQPDFEAVIDANLDAEKEKLEQKAREKLQKELGGDSGGSLEDQIKDRLLRKLFD